MEDFSLEAIAPATTPQVRLGQVVCSKAGRDLGSLYVIIRILDDRFVEVADGERRPTGNPKRKNLRHLALRREIFEDFARRLEAGDALDSDLRRYLMSLMKSDSNE